MKIHYTEISETSDSCEVEMLIADDPDPENASAYIELKVSLPKQRNPLLAQVQKDTLQYMRNIIDEKIQETGSRANQNA